MKGVIEKYSGYSSVAWIKGEDGETYFSHKNDFANTKKLVKGNIVEFDVQDESPHMRAVAVKKTGLGKRHPFANSSRNVIAFLETLPQSEERDYKIRDMNVIYNYFCSCEDFEKYRCPEVVFSAERRDG